MVPRVPVGDYLQTDNHCEQKDRAFQRCKIVRINCVRIEDSEQRALEKEKNFGEQRNWENQKTQKRIVFRLEAEEEVAILVKGKQSAEFPSQTLTTQTPEIRWSFRVYDCIGSVSDVIAIVLKAC